MKKFSKSLFLLVIVFGLGLVSRTSFAKPRNLIHQAIPSLYQAKLQYTDQVPVLVLKGTYAQMGYQYGFALKKELKAVLEILKTYFVVQHKLTDQILFERANLLYKRFPNSYQLFINSASAGSGLPLQDMIILNGMLSLDMLLRSQMPFGCAFAFVPPNKTTMSHALIGRNFDYSPPFDQLAKYLTITVLKMPNKIPTAFIGIPGEIYCATCVNAKGLFVELNSGQPSGGYVENNQAENLGATILTAIQVSDTLGAIEKKLQKTSTDFSLIVNVTDSKKMANFEYSTSPILGMQNYRPNGNEVFVATNFFTNPLWGSKIPTPIGSRLEFGVERHAGLSSLLSKLPLIDIEAFKRAMSVSVNQGGAVHSGTIYQIIFDPYHMDLYIKTANQPKYWRKVPLKAFF
jgi:hypothetical protein